MEVNISWGALWKILAMAALVVVLFISRDVLVAVLLALILSSAFDPMVNSLERKHVPRILGTLLIYILSLIIIAVIIYIVVPVALVELNGFFTNSNGIVGSLVNNFGQESARVLQNLVDQLNTVTAGFLGGEITLLSILSKVLGGVFYTIVVFIISFYLTIDRDGVEQFLMTILPPTYHGNVLAIVERVRVKIGRWFMSQLLLSAIIGISVYLGLWLLGVKYSLLLGIVAGLLELVPYVGPIFSGSMAVLFALSTSVSLGIYTLILFVIIQQVESNFLAPLVLGKSTALSPVIVLAAILIGAQVFGVVGAILAIPMAVMFQEILKHWSHSHRSVPPAVT